MLIVGFGGDLVNVDAYGAELELNGSNGKMEMKKAKEGVKC